MNGGLIKDDEKKGGLMMIFLWRESERFRARVKIIFLLFLTLCCLLGWTLECAFLEWWWSDVPFLTGCKIYGFGIFGTFLMFPILDKLKLLPTD